MRLILKLIIMVGFFGGTIYFVEEGKRKTEMVAQSKLAPYNAQIDRYLNKKLIAKNKVPAQGKIVFVDEKTKTLDKFSDYQIIPSDEPSTPDEVNSVILHNCEYLQVGTYTNGSKAMQHVCDFTVINVDSGAWSTWGEFRGTMPPEEIRRKRASSSDETGGLAIYSFFAAGGLVHRKAAAQ